MSCHSSVLAAVSPVLKGCLSDLDHVLETVDNDSIEPGVIIISEISMTELLPLFYTGQVSVTTSSKAGEVWAGLAELGVEAGLEMRRGGASMSSQVLETHDNDMMSSVVTIMLGVDQDSNGTGMCSNERIRMAEQKNS